MKRSLACLTCLAALTLGGCMEDAIGPRLEDPTFGAAVRHNMAQHIIHPAPNPDWASPADGQRRAIAIERYRKDEVEPPVTTAISDVGPTGASE